MTTSYIKKLELQGFKSFPERTKILFHPGITAIIGPNGTGKSNIVDGLLWVLGGQRPRAVRGEKIDDIIFNGNAKKAPTGMVDVTVNLANEPEELIINHRAYRSGEGEYRMDGKAVRLKDIQDELWKRAIGDKEYFVIEQGSIGQFVTSKPLEKRFLLEAAAGTAFYKDKRRQAENKLEDSELNLTRLEDIIEEVAKAKNSLQRQAQAATRYRKLRERIRELTALHFRRKLIQVEKRQAEVAGQFTRFVAQEKDGVAAMGGADKDVQLKRQALWDLEKSLKLEQESLFALKTSAARMEADSDKEAKRVEFLEEKKKRSQSDLEELRREEAELVKEAEAASSGLDALNGEILAKRQETARAEEERAKLRTVIPEFARTLESRRQEYVLKFAAATEIKNEQAKLDKEAELVARQEEKLGERLAREQSRLAGTRDELRRLAESREALKAERAAAGETEAKRRSDLAACENILKEIQAAAASLRERRDSLLVRLQALKKMIESERGGISGEEIPGALGLLADFVEANADTIRLLDILWKDESRARVVPAQDFLGFLQNHDVQGQFVILPPFRIAEAVPAAAIDRAALGLIKERLRIEPKLAQSLSRLKDAVIVSDLKTAVELWLRYPDCNFVTLSGDLLLATGLLRPAGRTDGFFSLNQDIKKLEEELSRVEIGLLPVTSSLNDKLKEKQQVEDDLRRLSERVSELDREVMAQDQKHRAAEAEQAKQAEDTGLLEKEIGILRSERDALTPLREALTGRIASAQDEADGRQKNSEEADRAQQDALTRLAEAERLALEFSAAAQVLEEKSNGLNRQLKSLGERRVAAAAKARAIEEEVRSGESEQSRLRLHIQELFVQAAKLEAERLDKESRAAQAEARYLQFQKDLGELEALLKSRREEQERVKEERVKWEVARAETERDLVNLEETCWQELRKSVAEIRAEIGEDKVGGDEIETELEEAKDDLQRYKAVNLMAEDEYLAQKERHDFLVKQRDDLRQSIASTKEAIQKIDQESESMFMTALAEVNTNFQQVFAILFNGGTAEVKLTEPDRPLESGVEIVAQPPGKKVQSMTLLSGGEKSLTSLGFLFALFRYKPAPFCILDEVDAALDDINLGRFLELMKKVKTETQFIIVTHNYKTMEVADFIYGTTMSEPNVTSIYSMKLEKKEAPGPSGS